jgi:hypothetical protein
MKLLSDFDGVWTNPVAEAAAQGEVLDARLLDVVADSDREAARAWVAAARRESLAAPARWGWTSDGRLAAFADEDPFSAHSALLHLLVERAASEPLAARILTGARAAGEGSLDAFSTAAHLDGVARVERTRGPGVLPGAAAAGRELLAAGVETVIVSNSDGEKLERWFSHAGIPHAMHPRRAEHGLRLRGAAGKHWLEPGRSRMLDLDGVRVELERPHYEAILREEAPDAVVGDVFSLDLALPLSLRRSEPSWKHVRIFWIVRDYAPARMRRALAAAAPEVEQVTGGFEDVAAALLAAQAGGT